MDVSKLTVIGNTWGEFKIEKYAALSPDLLVSTMFDEKGTLWYVPEESADKILELAPSVGISVYDRQMTQPLARLLELAGSLGADVKAEKTVKAKKRFEDAAARLRKAAKVSAPRSGCSSAPRARTSSTSPAPTSPPTWSTSSRSA